MNRMLAALLSLGVLSCQTPAATASEFRINLDNLVGDLEAAIIINERGSTIAFPTTDGYIFFREFEANDGAYAIPLTLDFVLTFDLDRCTAAQPWEAQTLDGSTLQARCVTAESVTAPLPPQLASAVEGGFLVELSGSRTAQGSYQTAFTRDGAFVGVWFRPDEPPLFQGASAAWLVRGGAIPLSDIVNALGAS